MWDGEVIKVEAEIKKNAFKDANNTNLDFCVMATSGNHVLEVYGVSRYHDINTRWSFTVNGSEWLDFTVDHLNGYRHMSHVDSDTVVEFG